MFVGPAKLAGDNTLGVELTLGGLIPWNIWGG